MAYLADRTILDRQCDSCPLGWDEAKQEYRPCPVAFVQHAYNQEQVENYQFELGECLTALVDDKGVCQVRALLGPQAARVMPPRPLTNTLGAR